MKSASTYKIAFGDLRSFCKQTYLKVGVPDDEAEIVSDLLARSDLRGIETHGVTRLPIYIQRLQKDYVRKKCEFNVIRQKGATAFVNANGSMGHVVSYKAMQLALDLAMDHGIGWVTVVDSGHFGVTGLFPMMGLEHDMIGFICSNSAPMMAPYGGKKRIIGNNPLSYAFPAENHIPIVVDFSCSVVASGRLILARKKGEEIPLGWAVDKNGLPTTDPGCLLLCLCFQAISQCSQFPGNATVDHLIAHSKANAPDQGSIHLKLEFQIGAKAVCQLGAQSFLLGSSERHSAGNVGDAALGPAARELVKLGQNGIELVKVPCLQQGTQELANSLA